MTSFEEWIGRRRETLDHLDPARAQALAAALGRSAPLAAGDVLPQLFHWLYFWDLVTPEETGPDGHRKTGGFLPPIPAPRRMWAGGQLSFHAPLRLGEAVRRVSTVTDLKTKEGRSGALTFVTLHHEVHGAEGLAISEHQDIVYRSAPTAAAARAVDLEPPPTESDWSLAVTADPVLLFRYSALSMNSHRIHYDRPYAVDVEGYPDLVVHGPLLATLMLGAATAAAGSPATEFRFRGLAPTFCGRGLTVRGRSSTSAVWTEQSGARTMEGEVSFGAAG